MCSVLPLPWLLPKLGDGVDQLHDVLCWIVLLGYVVICASDIAGGELGVWSMLPGCLEERRLCN